MLSRFWNSLVGVAIGLATYGALSFIEFQYPIVVAILVAVIWTEFFELTPRRRCSKKVNIGPTKKEELD